jgi:predicted  nucleic acid-binding Zn-ribbon protein
MMDKHLCPKCGKNSYSADEVYFSACPYCGLRFSSKYGPDRRREKRVSRESDILFNFQGVLFEATLTDLSREGLGIKISGEVPVSVGETVELPISDSRIKAKVMWINNLSDEKSLVGLQRLNEAGVFAQEEDLNDQNRSHEGILQTNKPLRPRL